MIMTKQGKDNFSSFLKENPRLFAALENIEIELGQTRAERDRLKQRCEAYERAMYGDCKYCVNQYQCPERYDCRNEECVKFVGNTWQFNEARFMNGGDNGE